MPLTLPPLLPDRPRRLALLDPHPGLRLGVEMLLRQHAGVQVRVSLSSEAHLLHLLDRAIDGHQRLKLQTRVDLQAGRSLYPINV